MKVIPVIAFALAASLVATTGAYAVASKYKTYTHKVRSENCEQTRKEINNRCLYKHKMGKKFCAKQDAKNAAICVDLRQKHEEYQTQQKAAEDNFNACIKQSECDQKGKDMETKMCYEHCHKVAGYE